MNDFDPLTPGERNARLETGGDIGKAKARDPRLFVRSSFNAPPPPSTTFNGRPPVRTDLYLHDNGAPSLFVERFEWRDPREKGGKAKRFRQHSLRGDESAPEWVAEGFPDSELLPLFNLPEILANPDKPIVLVEGEKKIDAARVIFEDDVIPTTAAMGASSFHRTDVSPVAGHPVIVWRDHDAAGERHLRAAAEALNKVGCRILVIDVAELVKVDGGARGVTHDPVGWDCADAVVEWNDLAALRDVALRLAKPYEDESGEAEGMAASSTPGDDEREIFAKLARGDGTDFLTRAKTDPGFPFEPEAIAALNKFAKDRPADWQRLRAQLKTSKILVSALEAMMKAEAEDNNSGGDSLPGRPIKFEEIEPWDKPVDGAELLTDVADAIGRYVIMDAQQRDAAALGAVFAHAHDLRDTAPIFFIVSPTKRCGKTRLERVIKRLVPKPLIASSATPAFLARLIEKHRPTVLIDEYDATVTGDQAMAETLRGQLNSSFDRDGAQVGKCVPLPGGGYEEREFSTWAPTWIAGIKKIPETVEDRSVVLRLKRKLPGEKVARFRGKDGGELSILRRKIARFVADNEQRLRDIEPDMPEALSAAGDRAPDAWEPLVAIADVAGGAWPQRARNAALALSGVDVVALADSDVDVELLFDISQILDVCDAYAPTAEQLKTDKLIAVQALEAVSRSEGQDGGNGRPRRVVGLGGEQLTNALATFVERKWPTWDKGKPIRPHQLARLLRAYGVVSQPLRDGATVFRGYPRDRLDDAIGRYLIRTPPSPGEFTRHSVAGLEDAEENELFENVTEDARNTLKNAGDPSNSVGRDSVTPKSAGDDGVARHDTDGVSETTPKWRRKM
jgi:Protein of unknown function (DUF3631)